MPVTKEDVAQAKQDALNKKNQERMEKDVYGNPVTTPKPPTVKKAAGGSVGSASKRADGCAQRGKTKGRMV